MLAYLDGRFVPRDEATLAIHDAGIVFGATVTDFARTYHGNLWRYPDHLRRFRADCAACFVPMTASDDDLTAAARHLIGTNHPGTADVAVVTFATPGKIGLYAGTPGDDGPPTLAMHTFALDAARYAPFFTRGVRLSLAGVHGAGSDDLAPPRHKHRSRLHWWRASKLAPPGTTPLLQDATGHVTETAVGNVLAVVGGEVLTPPRGSVLAGVSLAVVEELCAVAGVPFRETPLGVDACRGAAELMLAGTAFGLAGVGEFDGTAVAWPGEVTRRLMDAWRRETDRLRA